MTSINYLYSLLKSCLSGKVSLSNLTKYHLVETLFIGYYNKIDEFIKIFDMLHKDILVKNMQKLGVDFIAHFYKLAGMQDMNEKLHDYMHYETILSSKGKISIKNYYVSKNTQKMSLVYKPLSKILFEVDSEDEQFDILLQAFVVMKRKMDISKNDSIDMIELPDLFVDKIDSKIAQVYKQITQSASMIGDSDSILITENKELAMRLYILIKVLAISGQTKAYDDIIKDCTKCIKAYRSEQKQSIKAEDS